MPPKLDKGKEVSLWLEKAIKDITSAKILFRANDATQWHQVLFFCQQAVEKSMKGFLTWHAVKFRWTHDLVELGKQCTDIDGAIENDVSPIKDLTEYAWEFRYPGEDEEPKKEEAKNGICRAEKFVSTILGRLPLEAHPEPARKAVRSRFYFLLFNWWRKK